MRFGLVGTGPWARLTHGPGLVAAPGLELGGVWGRSTERAGRLAADLGTASYPSYDDLLADVDAVAFAVPPDVQVALALSAARAGKHLLLDKPVSTDPGTARELVEAVEAAGVTTVVFFTDRFAPQWQAWHDETVRTGGWRGGWSRWLTSLDAGTNPFRESAWRRERGALWDIGPHVLSTLSATLGPLTSLHAVGGAADTVTLSMTHEGGATSTATLSLFAPPAANDRETTLWGESGFSTMPGRRPGEDPACLARAARQLVDAADAGERHPLDVAFGAEVVGWLSRAQVQLDTRTGS
ncbi:Gfo/Idh/MocA family oxidoreductase [Nocardioides sp. 616]|uniref:Gfo/Idh/MocA family protein n=1 Tax=Nocardioides sp. 616 TaxID=2268090 RepID=UPI000CE4E3A3|nr:Gfo/Idh/MocA family oxidoreductase [Nocardioides sp. 616]